VGAFALSRFPTYFADQPRHKLAKLHYSNIALVPNLASSTIYTKLFRANSVFEPEVGAGHQPSGYDQLMAQYSHFTVLYSTIRLEEQQAGVAANLVFTVYQHNLTTDVTAAYAAGGVNALDELFPKSSNLIVTGGQYGSRDRSTTPLHFSAPKVFSKTPADLVGDAGFQGAIGANPTEDAYFTVEGHTPTGASTSNAIPLKVSIDYWAVFTEPVFFNTQ
jgi:hypothetical protein